MIAASYARQKRRVIYDTLVVPEELKRIVVEYTISAGELVEEYAHHHVCNYGHIYLCETLKFRIVMWWSKIYKHYITKISIFHEGAVTYENRIDAPRKYDDYIGAIRKPLEQFRLSGRSGQLFCLDDIMSALQQIISKVIIADATE